VASIDTELSDFHRIVSSAAPEPEEIVAWCAQIGDSIMVDDVVTAIQGHFMRKRQPQADKRPSALCRHLACLKQHSPDDCCICSGQRHPIEKCWHISGLPAGKQHMADQYKFHFQQSTGPWVNQPKVHSITPEATVLSVLIPAKDLVSPSLSMSGQVLNEAEGDLHDVKEMDFGFILSFLKHHLSAKPNVSAHKKCYRGRR
jgi:hypothetical protein